MGAIGDLTAEFRNLPGWGKVAAIGGAGLAGVLIIRHARAGAGSSVPLGLYPSAGAGTTSTNAPPTGGGGNDGGGSGSGSGNDGGGGGSGGISAALLNFIHSLAPDLQQADVSYFQSLSPAAQAAFLQLPLAQEESAISQYNSGLPSQQPIVPGTGESGGGGFEHPALGGLGLNQWVNPAPIAATPPAVASKPVYIRQG